MKTPIRMLAVVAVMTMALASCSESSEFGPDASVATDAPPASEPTATAAAAPTSEPALTTEALGGGEDDPYCALAIDNLEASEAAADAASATSTMMSADIGEINEWGQSLVESANASLTFYTEAPPLVDDAATVEALEKMGTFISTYSIPVGEAAANAADKEDLTSAFTAVVMDSDIATVLEEAPASAKTILDYTVDRCGDLAS